MSRPRMMLSLAVAALCASGVARADQACADAVNLPNPIYMAIGDTQVNLIMNLGKKLRDAGTATLVWQATGSCTNLGTIYDNTKLTGSFSYIPANWDPTTTPTPPTCTAATAGVNADIANSIVFLSSCPGTQPSTVTDVLGPVQSFVFVVPTASSQTVITAEEAYFVFGFGAAGMITPWDVVAQMFVRPATKGTVISMGASIKVPAGKWMGTPIAMSTDVATDVAMSTMPAVAIGILGSEVYDKYRTTLTSLAFRAFEQYHAYFPDSTSSSHDRQNVRDGHYHMWSYTHWLYTTDGSGNPVNALAKMVVDLIAGNAVTPAPTFEPLDSTVAVGLVPQCAMKVTRTVEGGDFSLDSPASPCGCYFDSKVSTTACTACTDDTTCNGGKCRHGYCEAR